ncbi:MAG: glycosyltransferase, partial [Gemmatimonadales bacterium]|nr:glycosyltransferase [Gemmatimonadales bacterium]
MTIDTRTNGLKVFQVLAGGPWGGAAVVVLALTRVLIEAGCQVWVLCLDDLVARRFAEAGAQVVRCDTWRREINPPHDLLAFLQLFQLCRREQFDLVNTTTSKGGFLGRLAAR